MTRHLAASYGTLVVLRKTKEKHIERTARRSRKENIIFFRLIEAQLVHVIPAAEPMLLRPSAPLGPAVDLLYYCNRDGCEWRCLSQQFSSRRCWDRPRQSFSRPHESWPHSLRDRRRQPYPCRERQAFSFGHQRSRGSAYLHRTDSHPCR